MVSKVAQQVKTMPCKLGGLGSIPGAHTVVLMHRGTHTTHLKHMINTNFKKRGLLPQSRWLLQGAHLLRLSWVLSRTRLYLPTASTTGIHHDVQLSGLELSVCGAGRW